MNYNNNNGKINIMGPNISTKFSMMDKIPLNTRTDYSNSLTGVFEKTNLSNTFFSNQNIEIIQNGLKKGVSDKSNGKIVIDNQPTDQLVTIMRSIFFQNSKNLDTNVREQVEELNNLVLNYAVPKVLNEAIAYLKYKEDSSRMHMPMSAPLYSNKTNKTLEQKPWF